MILCIGSTNISATMGRYSCETLTDMMKARVNQLHVCLIKCCLHFFLTVRIEPKKKCENWAIVTSIIASFVTIPLKCRVFPRSWCFRFKLRSTTIVPLTRMHERFASFVNKCRLLNAFPLKSQTNLLHQQFFDCQNIAENERKKRWTAVTNW